ncbi:MAG TPA: SRPBCC domain-containing protein [Xanthobacteraceae bacterium]
MNKPATITTRSIVVEREMPHPPEKVWRALTQSTLIEEWLMPNDFKPIVGHKFNFRWQPAAGWNGVADCEVLTLEPPRRLAWSQNASGQQAANGLKSVVTWTLTPTKRGVLVRMEHSGFRPEDEAGYKAMSGGWPHVLEGLERVTAGLD